jgi:hypothetical protein
MALARTKKPKSKTAPASIGMKDWQALVQASVAATDAKQVRKLVEKADGWKLLPIDVLGACQGAAEEKRAIAIMNEMSQSLDRRIDALDASSDLVHQLCLLRDIVHTT